MEAKAKRRRIGLAGGGRRLTEPRSGKRFSLSDVPSLPEAFNVLKLLNEAWYSCFSAHQVSPALPKTIRKYCIYLRAFLHIEANPKKARHRRFPQVREKIGREINEISNLAEVARQSSLCRMEKCSR